MAYLNGTGIPFERPASLEISAILDGLRGRFPDCQNVAYVDLTSGMILASSSDRELAQERWDDLAGAAIEMLTGAVASQVAGIVSPDSPAGVSQAVIVEPDELGVFVKSNSNPQDAIAGVCATGLALDGFVSQVQMALGQIDADG